MREWDIPGSILMQSFIVSFLFSFYSLNSKWILNVLSDYILVAFDNRNISIRETLLSLTDVDVRSGSILNVDLASSSWLLLTILPVQMLVSNAHFATCMSLSLMFHFFSCNNLSFYRRRQKSYFILNFLSVLYNSK